MTTTTAAATAATTTNTTTSTTPAREDGAAVLAAWLGFLFGTAISVGGNVLATWLPRLTGQVTDPAWTPGIWPQIGAAVWPLALLLSVEVLTRTNWRAGLQWAIARLGGILAVALGGAVISYGHLHEVLTAWKYPAAAAFVGPLVIDGLMLISGFALLSISKNLAEHDAAELAEIRARALSPRRTRPNAATTATTATNSVHSTDPQPATGVAHSNEPAVQATTPRSRAKRPAPGGSRRAAARGTGNQDKARAVWDAAPEDRKPSGAELARAAGVDPSMGRRWRREWETETTAGQDPSTGETGTAGGTAAGEHNDDGNDPNGGTASVSEEAA